MKKIYYDSATGEIIMVAQGSATCDNGTLLECPLSTLADYIDATGAPATYTADQAANKRRKPFWPCAWSNITMSWEGAPDLEMLRASKWAEVKRNRADAEGAGFTWSGHTFDSDPISQQRIQGAVQLASASVAASQPFAVEWTLQDNTVVTLSALDMIAVGNALAAHVGSAFAAARALRTAVDAATTPAELASITWPPP